MFISEYAMETVKTVTRIGDLAVVTDSDGGGRCWSTRKRFTKHTHVVSDPARSMSLCGMTAFSYVRRICGEVCLKTSDTSCFLPAKGEMAVQELGQFLEVIMAC